MAKNDDKSGLMRNLGAFVGHIVKAVRTDPAKPDARADETHEVKREVEEERRPGMVLRRTTIEEIEYRNADDRDPE